MISEIGMELTLNELSEVVGGAVTGDGGYVLRGVSPFETATPDDITFAGGPGYLKRLSETRAGAVIIPLAAEPGPGNYLIVENPQLAFFKILPLFHPHERESFLERSEDIGYRAFIGKSPEFGKNVFLSPGVIVGNNVKLGDGVKIYPNTVVGDDVTIGDDTVVYPNVSISSRSKIGARVIIHAGTVIGSDGFGFVPDGRKYFKINHIGFVQIDDDVEIGANNTIDRATFGKTWIKRGVKTDNLVHVAHNVVVGEDTVLVAQVGIAGSVTVGNHAILAGQAGVTGHLTIGDDVTVGPQAGIAKSVPNGLTVSGSPEMPHRQWLRVQRIIPMLPDMKKEMAAMEKRIRELEERLDKKE